MEKEEKSRVITLVAVFFVLIAYLALSPFSRFIVFIPASVLGFIKIFDYVLGAGVIIFFFSRYSVLSFREIYVRVKESRFGKGFLIMLLVFFLVSVFSYLSARGISLVWGILTTLIAGLLLSSFIFHYTKYLDLSLGYSKEKVGKEFEVRKKRNFLLFSAFTGLLFAVPGVIFALDFSFGIIYVIFSILSWIVFALGVLNYFRYVKLVKKGA